MHYFTEKVEPLDLDGCSDPQIIALFTVGLRLTEAPDCLFSEDSIVFMKNK